MTTAVIYVRVSSGIQEDGYSLGFQEDHCRAYASGHGYTVAGVYSDVHTGSQWRERPGLTALRQALAAGGIDVVICYALDRLSRDQTHIAVLVDEFEYRGARLELTTESFEDSAVGKLIRNVKAFAAEIEREKIIARSVDGRRAKVLSGKPSGQGRPLFGYRWRDAEKTGWEFNPETAPIARRIYQEALAGVPIRAIARGLTNDGIPTPTGKAVWSHETIRVILRHPGYSGRAYSWAWRPKGTKSNPVFDEEQAILLPEGTMPALVTVEEWEQVREQLRRNQQRAARNMKVNHEALMRAGLAICGHCGSTMYVHNSRARKPYVVYECERGYEFPDSGCRYHSIPIHVIDTAVWERLTTILTHPDVIAREIRRMIETDPATLDLASVERRLKAVGANQRNLIRQLAAFSDPDAAAAVRAEIESLSRQRQQLETERNALLAQRSAWEQADAYLDDLEAWIASVVETLDDLDYAQRRSLVEWFGFTVTIWNRHTTPRYEITAAIPLDGFPIATTSSATCGHNRTLTLRWPAVAAD